MAERRASTVRGTTVAAALSIAVLGWPAGARGQVVIDRDLVIVQGQVITQSDVWQAIELDLLPGASTPAAVQRELENRVLILSEAARLQAATPAAEAVQAARRRWEARVGPETVAGRLERAGASEATLDAWFRDSVAIESYLDRRFGAVREEDRERARAEWIALLRNREGLPR